MGKTSMISHTVVNTNNGKEHSLQGIGWYNFNRDIIIVLDFTANQTYRCYRSKVLEAKTLEEFEASIYRRER